MASPALEIKGFLETSFVDWPGNICSVVFTPGCNLRCPFCHNHDLVLNPGKFESFPREYVLERLAAFKGWIDGVCITGGEPTLQEGLEDFLRTLHSLGFLVKLDTNGTDADALKRMLDQGMLDYVAMDVKGPLNDVDYCRAAGKPVDLEHIRRSIDLLKQSVITYEFRTTVVPSLHGEQDILSMAGALSGGALWRLQPFRPDNALNRSYRSIRPYDSSVLERFARLAESLVHTVH